MCIYISSVVGLILYKVWCCHKGFLRTTEYNIQMTDYRRKKSKTNNNIYNGMEKPLDANTLRDVWRTYLLKRQRRKKIAWKRCGIITKRCCQTACIFARLQSIHVMKILAHVCCILEKNKKQDIAHYHTCSEVIIFKSIAPVTKELWKTNERKIKLHRKRKIRFSKELAWHLEVESLIIISRISATDTLRIWCFMIPKFCTS